MLTPSSFIGKINYFHLSYHIRRYVIRYGPYIQDMYKNKIKILEKNGNTSLFSVVLYYVSNDCLIIGWASAITYQTVDHFVFTSGDGLGKEKATPEI